MESARKYGGRLLLTEGLMVLAGLVFLVPFYFCWSIPSNRSAIC